MRILSHFTQATIQQKNGELLQIRAVSFEGETQSFIKNPSSKKWQRYEEKLQNSLTISETLKQEVCHA